MPNVTVALEPDDNELLPPQAAAKLGGVSVKTLVRWERIGKISARRTAGGHRRFYRGDVLALTGGTPQQDCGLDGPRVEEL